MSHMFYYARSFNQHLGDLNVSNVTDMSHVFGGAQSFNKDLSRWNLRDDSEVVAGAVATVEENVLLSELIVPSNPCYVH